MLKVLELFKEVKSQAWMEFMELRQHSLDLYQTNADELLQCSSRSDAFKLHVTSGLPGWLQGGGYWQACIAPRYTLDGTPALDAFRTFHPSADPVLAGAVIDQKQLSVEINEIVKDWCVQNHLLSQKYFPMEKLEALNVGVAMPLMYRGFLKKEDDMEKYKAELVWIGKFLAWIFIVDDCLEQKSLHKAMSQAVRESFDIEK